MSRTRPTRMTTRTRRSRGPTDRAPDHAPEAAPRSSSKRARSCPGSGSRRTTLRGSPPAPPGNSSMFAAPDYSGLVLRRPFSSTLRTASAGAVTIHFRVIGRRHRVDGAAETRRTVGDARAAGPAVRGRPRRGTSCSSRAGSASPVCGRSRTRRSATAPGDAAVRGRERERGLPVARCCPTKWSTSFRPTTAARPSRPRDGARHEVRGVGRPGVRLRPAPDARGDGRPRGDASAVGSGLQARSPARPRNGARSGRQQARRKASSRCPWSRTWAAPSEPASAA